MPPGGIRTHNLNRRAAADLRLRPRGHWDRQWLYVIYVYSYLQSIPIILPDINSVCCFDVMSAECPASLIFPDVLVLILYRKET